ncbi:hypothetical protein CWI39_0310p0030 [Hamiltosporidium magnivora]|uniref:Uncharacterized protein n=1 Tax=Hamiltosporidium magnivora TaxID=148818 RepID=A0A4Q9LHG8_9MICR|nr:hypothetical protein CWI39_0310p0030 [Hamiltosporidium magnivora]
MKSITERIFHTSLVGLDNLNSVFPQLSIYDSKINENFLTEEIRNNEFLKLIKYVYQINKWECSKYYDNAVLSKENLIPFCDEIKTFLTILKKNLCTTTRVCLYIYKVDEIIFKEFFVSFLEKNKFEIEISKEEDKSEIFTVMKTNLLHLFSYFFETTMNECFKEEDGVKHLKTKNNILFISEEETALDELKINKIPIRV